MSELTGNQPDASMGTNQGGTAEKKPDDTTLGQDLFQTLQTLVCAIFVIIILFTFVARVTVVSGSSMENTLHGGDIVVTWALGYTPKQGDIVVLTKTSFQDESIIKRVIATGGQTVDIDYNTSTVYVDGVALDEPYIKDYMWDIWDGSGLDHVTVPEGSIYVMGDNRNNSSDSRLSSIGVVDARCVIGRAVVVLFPFSDFGGL
jgi:signal peptidase I